MDGASEPRPDNPAGVEAPTEGSFDTNARCLDGSVYGPCVPSRPRDVSLKQKIIAIFDQDNSVSTKFIVEKTGANISHVQRVLRETGLRESRRIGDAILEAQMQHPDWKPRKIAEHVGCSIYHVRRLLTWAPMDKLRALGLAARAAGFTEAELRAIAAERAKTSREAAE